MECFSSWMVWYISIERWELEHVSFDQWLRERQITMRSSTHTFRRNGSRLKTNHNSLGPRRLLLRGLNWYGDVSNVSNPCAIEAHSSEIRTRNGFWRTYTVRLIFEKCEIVMLIYSSRLQDSIHMDRFKRTGVRNRGIVLGTMFLPALLPSYSKFTRCRWDAWCIEGLGPV